MSWPTGYVPVLPLKNTVIYPDVNQALRVGREKSLKALQAALKSGHWILALTQREEGLTLETANDFHEIGVLAKIESVKGQPETGYQVILRGYRRVRRLNLHQTQGYFESLYEPADDLKDIDPATESALLQNLRDLTLEVLKPNETLGEALREMKDLQELAYWVSAHADFPVQDKQKVLEIDGLKDRAMWILGLLHNMKEALSVQADIRQKLNNRFGQSQRQQILREQLRAIKEELGEGEPTTDDYEKKIESLDLPKEALELARSQARRLEEITSASPEYHVTKNHLDFLLSLPWKATSSQDEIDLEKAGAILDADHFGLEKVKKRILQHLAVMKLTQGRKGSILLLVGPPGVGKTSLGQSIARALGRKYTRASLGGVRDDAEIRGHRRTYVGALPGRILASLKKAGEKDPVMILDEIDKMSRGFAGDPASAMLEVLDLEQNASFMDHYLDTPFDLSKVFFIGTANSLEGIPGPLLDRMEVVEIGSYTSAEKLQIAKTHLVPKQMGEHGLLPEHLELSDEVLLRIITHYTREAGVRELQRRIAEVCRWASERVVETRVGEKNLKVQDLEEILGQEKFNPQTLRPHQGPGVVAGLAWTPVGGDLLYIEAAMMPGQGRLTTTGQLGDVMKESASLAVSLLKSRMAFFNPTFDFSKFDLHVHAPAGAIPKDGPSAGVTLLASLASLLTGREVPTDCAMTGEITLTGAVLPVGGIKEKLIAAHRNGAHRVLIPKANEKDLKNLSTEVLTDLKVELAENVNQVLKWALDLDFPGGMVGASPQQTVHPSEPTRPQELN